MMLAVVTDVTTTWSVGFSLCRTGAPC